MLYVLAICCAMAGDDGSAAKTRPADLSAYEFLQAKVGKDATAHARLALWCEQHGLTAERAKHLALAVATDPANALARGLMGMVAYQGKWGKPEEVERQVQEDPTYHSLISEYLDRRSKTAHKPDAQLKLAAWCKEKGLKEQALAHYNEVVRLDSSRETAWMHLGYKKQGNHWIKPEEAAGQKLEGERQKHADQLWRPRLEKLRQGLESSHPARRDKAREGMAEVTDQRAVPMVCRVFASGGDELQLAAVGMLSQIDGPSASNALATLAIFSQSKDVRSRAVTALAHRDPRDVVGRLINLIRRPFKYKVREGHGPGTTGELLVEGEAFNFQRLYQFSMIDMRTIPVTQPNMMWMPGMPAMSLGQNGPQPGSITVGNTKIALGNNNAAGNSSANSRMMNQVTFLAQQAAVAAFNAAQTELMIANAMAENLQRNQAVQQSLANDIETIEAINAQLNQSNDRVLPVLKTLTGHELGSEPEAWQKWWTDQLGYVYQSSQPETKPTITETVSEPDVIVNIPMIRPAHSACFAAGTVVHTIDGRRAIESIQVGDRVLSQNTSTGLLAFQPVMAVHKNEPTATLRIRIEGETIVATGIHRFWKAGKGWSMARELKAGDQIRMVGGILPIDSIETDEAQPVYNLDVADNRDFFVGKKGLLVHDFSFVQPVATPFDRLPKLNVKEPGSADGTP